MRLSLTALLLPIWATPALAQATSDPFPTPLRATEGVIRVDYREFATIPDIDGQPVRMMLLVDEPGTRRLFVNDMRGPLFTVSYDGRTVTPYLNVDDAKWSMDVQSQGRERGFQSFAIHPQFNQQGAPGYGKLYTWVDVTDRAPASDFAPFGDGDSHDTVLLEWTARNPAASAYDGDAPRQLLRLQQPFSNHNGGLIAFNPDARPGAGDFGLLYIGNADGGSGGDPMNMAQNPASPFGKILRIDPLGSNSANGRYGIPAGNPFAGTGHAGTLGEIYAIGVRNPQRFGWDPANGRMFVADIGQNTIEELSPVTAGANLGWNTWEGSHLFTRGGVDTSQPRGNPDFTFPIAEFDHTDPILSGRSAITGVVVYRATAIPALSGSILFGDMPSGELFRVSADSPPAGGQDAIQRILLNDNGQPRTLLQLIQAKNTAQGRSPASRTDLRFGTDRDGRVFLLDKQDGTIRVLVAPSGGR